MQSDIREAGGNGTDCDWGPGKPWSTTFGVTDVSETRIRLEIDGLRDAEGANREVDLPLDVVGDLIPDWARKPEPGGWITLTAGSCEELEGDPRRHMLGFRPFENAHLSMEEIDAHLFDE